MKRREFITVLGGAAATWPLAARAQQMRLIGVLIAIEENDPEAYARVTAFRQGLETLGWVDRRKVRIDYRYVAGDVDRAGRDAAEMVAQGVNVIVVNSSPLLRAVQQRTRTVPIVFVQVGDPVGGGFVESLSHPGGNTTGFTTFEYSFAAKWVELLKEIAPSIVRAGVLRHPTIATNAAQYGAIQTAAPSFRMQIRPLGVRDTNEIERGIDAFARDPDGGLIVLPGPLATVHRDVIIASARRHALPTVYPYRYFTSRGGLISYGFDNLDLYRQAASYVDRILRGEKPAELPVQTPTKYELVVNLKTAKALGLEVPPTLLARADEVIE
jgi:putative tryptophan/tyrosine transport system substrate-binding protein